MIINYLELNDFRQFTGKQRIDFSTDPEKKVSLIMAESGVGKTTMIQCFQWIFYGECKYKNPLNGAIKNDLLQGETASVSCSLNISHADCEYTISRKQDYVKAGSQIRTDGDSVLKIDIKRADGISDQKRGRDADKIIKDLIHKDLFPYFFLEGENLTEVGEQMSKGKTGSNNEFVKAIKGLLGFNYLYETRKHLAKVCSEYEVDIARNTTDVRLKELVEAIQDEEKSIKIARERIETIDSEIEYNKTERDKISDDIQRHGELEGKQKRTKQLGNELLALEGKIAEQKRSIFKKFSLQGVYHVMNSMLSKAQETLENADAIDKGIPGIDVSAIEFMLANKKCVCGNELCEGTKEWETLNDWIKFLPPNNIGYEIKKFKSEMRLVESQSKIFNDDYEKLRKDLNSLIQEHNSKVDELTTLNEEIGSYSVDISKLKEKEKEYNDKISDLTYEKKRKEDEIANAEKRKADLKDEESTYKIKDSKVQKLQLYKNEAEYLMKKIERYCEKKENEKRIKLEEAINEIFADFYEEKIKFEVDSNYGVQIKTFDSSLSDDFTSGGQDVAVALAFIGAIIKLNKENPSSEELITDDMELYPLIMDAPTSNFGMKQMASFSEIMPKITDQIIVFINDKDGPILRSKMIDKIGKEWKITKEDTYHSVVKEVI